MEQSPSVTGQGAPVLGSRTTSVHYLHRGTGRLFNAVRSDQPAAGDATKGEEDAGLSAAQEAELRSVHARDVLVMGQVRAVASKLHSLLFKSARADMLMNWAGVPARTALFNLIDCGTGAQGGGCATLPMHFVCHTAQAI